MSVLIEVILDNEGRVGVGWWRGWGRVDSLPFTFTKIWVTD